MSTIDKEAWSGRPGQMTSAMRACTRGTDKNVLRIGLIHDGKVVEEKVIKHPCHVTVGYHETCTFVLNDGNAPSSFRLFELVDETKRLYALNVLPGMTGQLSIQGTVHGLEEFGEGTGRRTIPLTDDIRGKVMLGKTVFLFQFVPMPSQLKPQLPISVQQDLSSQVDWRFTTIASFSFLFHFGAAGFLYSDWMDPVVDEGVTAQLIQSIGAFPRPPAAEEPNVPLPTERNDSAPSKETGQSAGVSSRGKVTGKTGGQSRDGGGQLTDDQVGALERTLDQLNIATLGVLDGSGHATREVLREGDLPTDGLDQVARKDVAIGSASPGLNLGRSDGVIVGQKGSLRELGVTRNEYGTTSGRESEVKGPKLELNVGVTVVDVQKQLPDAQKVVSGLSWGFRQCYQKGLDRDPTMSGRVQLTAQVGPGGEVQSVVGIPSGTIDGGVVECVKAKMRTAQFRAPADGAATVVVPLSFLQQQRK